jgi:heat shock protein HtpX
MRENSIRLGALTGGVLLCGLLLGHLSAGAPGLVLAGVCAVLLLVVACRFAASWLLRLLGARPLAAGDYPWLGLLVAELSARAEIAAPRICMLESAAPNAFTVGCRRDKGTLVLTSGIMQLLTRDELAGVVAYQLAQIKQRDTLVTGIVTVLIWPLTTPAHALAELRARAGLPLLVGWLLDGLIGLLALLALPLVRAGLPVQRVYRTDWQAALLDDALPLASALEKIEWFAEQLVLHASPGTAPLFIVSPLARTSRLHRLLRTHPSTAQRVARLRALAAYGGIPAPLNDMHDMHEKLTV